MKDEREAYEKNSYHSINVPAVEAVTTTLMSLRYINRAIGPIYIYVDDTHLAYALRGRSDAVY